MNHTRQRFLYPLFRRWMCGSPSCPPCSPGCRSSWWPRRLTLGASQELSPGWRGDRAQGGGQSLSDYLVPHPRSLQRAAGASGYVECSALTGAGVKDVFDSAILAVLQPRSKEPERELLRDRANSSLRSLRRSSRSLRSSLSRQTSRSRTSLREAGLRSELGFGFVDRLRAWCRSRLRIRGRSSSLSSLREAGRRCELGLGVVDMVNAWGGSMWGSSAWAARETEIW